MKKITTIIIAILALTSCDSFLNRQDDEQMTFDKLWQQRKYTLMAFNNCMGYLPVDAYMLTNSGGTYLAATDEATRFNETAGFNQIIRGSLGTSAMPHTMLSTWYQGIRDCTFFLKNVNKCPDNDSTCTAEDVHRWYWGVRFTRAYLYFLIMREWGPVFLLGDEEVDFTATNEELNRPRNTWEECVDYVVSELTTCSQNLPAVWDDSGFWGMPTSGAALAVIARLKLYSARPLFNGNVYYKQVVNKDGTPLFPATADPNKWLEAAKANLEVILSGNYELYKDNLENPDPYLSYAGIFSERWNSELIFCSGGYRSNATFAADTAPYFLLAGSYKASGQWGPTQQQVDAYAMAEGRYPVTGYESDGTPRVDNTSGYPEPSAEFDIEQIENPYLVALKEPADNAKRQGPKMFKNREPRFYVNVYWPGSYFKCGSTGGVANFAIGGSGRGQVYPRSGYLVGKYYDHNYNYYDGGKCNDITFPSIRLGEIYLNYIESVLECEINGVSDPEVVDGDLAMQLWDELRKRSGMKSILDAYPEAEGSPSALLELVRRERRVELAHEGHRYFDTRTWMIAEDVDNGPMYGLKVVAVQSKNPERVPTDGWARYAYETRTFKKSYYLLPFAQREVDRNMLMVQNFGW